MSISRWLLPVSVLAFASAANGQVTVSYGASAPTYSNTLTFDEPGQATGTVPATYWNGIGISRLEAGVGNGYVGDLNSLFGVTWLGTGNAFLGVYGSFLTFSGDVTEFSCQYWDDSGPATFLGGGAILVALDNGAEVGSFFINLPTWNATGPTWVNITTAGTSVFDEVRFVGFGRVSPQAVIDNLSWNPIPAPASVGLLAVGALAGARRRRA